MVRFSSLQLLRKDSDLSQTFTTSSKQRQTRPHPSSVLACSSFIIVHSLSSAGLSHDLSASTPGFLFCPLLLSFICPHLSSTFFICPRLPPYLSSIPLIFSPLPSSVSYPTLCVLIPSLLSSVLVHLSSMSLSSFLLCCQLSSVHIHPISVFCPAHLSSVICYYSSCPHPVLICRPPSVLHICPLSIWFLCPHHLSLSVLYPQSVLDLFFLNHPSFFFIIFPASFIPFSLSILCSQLSSAPFTCSLSSPSLHSSSVIVIYPQSVLNICSLSFIHLKAGQLREVKKNCY